MSERAPYGTWKSPITAERITGSSTSTDDVIVDAVTSVVYHLEGRPAEKGRCVLVESLSGREIVPKDVNVRTGVHEYGSAAAIVHDGVAYYSNFADNRVYKISVKEGSQPEAVTPENKAFRYACFDIHPIHPQFLVSVLEDHTIDSPSTVTNTLVIIDTDAKAVIPLVSGADFYALPRFSPDGSKLAFQHWNHPNMPWDTSAIALVDIAVDTGGHRLTSSSYSSGGVTFSNSVTIAREGSNGSLAWANKDTLCFVSDVSGFINPWTYKVSTNKASPVFSSPVEEDFGTPLWILCYSPFAIVDEEGKVAVFKAYRDGRNILYRVNLESGERQEVQGPYVVVECMRTVSRSKGQFAFLGTKVDESQKVVIGAMVDMPAASFTSVSTGADEANKNLFDASLVTIPQGITLRVPPNDEPLHVIYYPPHNPVYAGSSIDGEKPPCVLNAHGGPTGMSFQGLQWKIQYWTTRGFAWLDVNYGGSFGYGKAYINRLRKQWGVVDVEDCIAATQTLSKSPHNLIDPNRTVIRGSSAGGLTVLNSLCNSSNTRAFAAATSIYGVADLVGLVRDTHKFESQYMFSLVGGSPTDVEPFKERSPINYVDKIDRPLLILQGEIDRVVPKEQAEMMYESIKKRGGVVEYKPYPGEGHGFRMKETQCDALERELAFYERVLALQGAVEGRL
ncbi:hypothetical protein GYMLUDRAFT_48458 [Collybiopsis luxurians FD-317 M1]|uniref:Peptidase S9 prolyl oligopeptidase catalytic domain-containing protein n=1 Tax=Collybiopsis luxurians FD-317 M1 TaxID=944289 RepID=A0A0D0C9S6_9AGAR|nr:hypothetical protein GYMLUDRAFT_48458 [Collybiopsis luxurians FD-317 M1]